MSSPFIWLIAIGTAPSERHHGKADRNMNFGAGNCEQQMGSKINSRLSLRSDESRP
jgi:hypothetical protein